MRSGILRVAQNAKGTGEGFCDLFVLAEVYEVVSWAVSISPSSYRVMVSVATAAVSARRMRGPRVTGWTFAEVASFTSSGVKPPSGPMKILILARSACFSFRSDIALRRAVPASSAGIMAVLPVSALSAS